MGKPRDNYYNPIHGVTSEIISAKSSLNMPSDPIEGLEERSPNDRPIFLSETDKWAKHAMEHMSKAWEYNQKTHQQVYKIRLAVWEVLLEKQDMTAKELAEKILKLTDNLEHIDDPDDYLEEE
jgi:hypothetical protein